MLKNFLLDLIFPRYCLGCKKELSSGVENTQICGDCLAKIHLNSGTQCHICGLRNPQGTCQKCRRKTPLKGLFAASRYEDPVLKEMIHLFKYQSVESLKKPLAELIIDYLKKELLIFPVPTLNRSSDTKGQSPPILVPIPLTRRRKLSRGFNQSELLAEEIGAFLNCPVINLLKRKKFTSPQAEISDWQERKENISGAFIIAPNINIIGFGNLYNKAILIDDVATSGATLEEAAMVLKNVGIKEIYGLVVAKG